MEKYLKQRRNELQENLKPECEALFKSGFDFIEARLKTKFSIVTPEMTRKLEMLEILLFSFLEHGMDLSLCDKMEKDSATMAGGQRSAPFRTLN